MRNTLFLFALLLIFSRVNAQYWEVGAYLGSSTYNGDLVDGMMDFKQIHPAGGVLVRYNINPWITLKGNVYYGGISGNDADASKIEKKMRNLSFKSGILDIGFVPEFNLRGYKSGHPFYKSSPYLFIGVNIFRFNPMAKCVLDNNWYALQPLGTEGQGTTKFNDRKKYSLTQVGIPFGLGWKYSINRYWNIGIELSAHKTFTDYLDDVSQSYVPVDVVLAAYGPVAASLSNRTGEVGPFQNYDASVDRGNPTKNDWYYFAGLFVSYSILPNRCYRF